MTRLPRAGQEPKWLQPDAVDASKLKADALHQSDRAKALLGRRLGWSAVALACAVIGGAATDERTSRWVTTPIVETTRAAGAAIEAIIPGDIPFIGLQDPITREDQIQRNMPDGGIRNSAALPDGTVVFLPPSRVE